jgi:hypothetical protein
VCVCVCVCVCVRVWMRMGVDHAIDVINISLQFALRFSGTRKHSREESMAYQTCLGSTSRLHLFMLASMVHAVILLARFNHVHQRLCEGH